MKSISGMNLSVNTAPEPRPAGETTSPFDTSDISVRPILEAELWQMEWGGEFSHFRRTYADTFERMRSGKAIIWVAVNASQEVIGQVCVQFDSPRPELANGTSHGYIFAFRVKPPYRSKGIGRRILATVEKDMRARGYSHMTLNVAKDNPAAQRFYKTNGYAVVASEPGNWSYIDQYGRRQHMHEPSWRFIKDIRKAF